MEKKIAVAALWLLVALCTACDHQRAVGVDGGATKEGGAADAGPRCSRLALVGKVNALGEIPGMSRSPAITADDQGFAVAWAFLPQPSSTGLMQLRFSRVSADGKPETIKGVALGNTTHEPGPAMVFHQSEYGLLHERSGKVTLLRLDKTGKVVGTHGGFSGRRSFALAAMSAGYAVLHSTESTPAKLQLSASVGGPSASTSVVHTGDWYIAPWIRQASSGLVMAWDDTLGIMDAKGKLKLVKPATKKATPALAVAVSNQGFGAVYARSMDYKLEFLPLDTAGKPTGSAKVVGQGAITAAAVRYLSLVWTGSQYVLVYENNGHHAQLLDADGTTAGGAVKLPPCMSWSHGRGAVAWNAGRAAVVYESGLSGPPHTAVCLAVLKCAQ